VAASDDVHAAAVALYLDVHGLALLLESSSWRGVLT